MKNLTLTLTTLTFSAGVNAVAFEKTFSSAALPQLHLMNRLQTQRG